MTSRSARTFTQVFFADGFLFLAYYPLRHPGQCFHRGQGPSLGPGHGGKPSPRRYGGDLNATLPPGRQART